MGRDRISGLLFITHAVDYDHTRTRFICRWLERFATYHNHVHVICQTQGRTSSLPDNVTVHSLGKENGASKPKQVISFLRLAHRLAKEADCVFVHNYPGWVLLGAPLWRRKPVFFWHCNKKKKLLNYVAGKLCDRIFTQSEHSFPYPMPAKTDYFSHGIDIDDFSIRKPANNKSLQLVTVGRLSPEKRIPLLLDAMAQVDNAQLKIVTAIANEANREELGQLLRCINNTGTADKVVFQFNVPNKLMADIYSEADVAVNLCETGALDKVVFEAMACGTPCLVANQSFKPYLESHWQLLSVGATAESVARGIQRVRDISEAKYKELGKDLRKIVSNQASVNQLIESFEKAMKRHLKR